MLALELQLEPVHTKKEYLPAELTGGSGAEEATGSAKCIRCSETVADNGAILGAAICLPDTCFRCSKAVNSNSVYGPVVGRTPARAARPTDFSALCDPNDAAEPKREMHRPAKQQAQGPFKPADFMLLTWSQAWTIDTLMCETAVTLAALCRTNGLQVCPTLETKPTNKSYTRVHLKPFEPDSDGCLIMPSETPRNARTQSRVMIPRTGIRRRRVIIPQ